MTIHPPQVVIEPGEPFKHALFGREEFGKSLVSLLCNVSDNLVIFVHAPWGAGKTTFAKMWLAHVQEQLKLEVVYYNAYEADYFDDPFVSFSGEILNLARRVSAEEGAAVRDEFKKTAAHVGKRLIGLATKVGLRAATLGAIESSDVDALKTIGAEVAVGVSEIGRDVIEKKIEHYTAEKDALHDFKRKLRELAVMVRKKQGLPLTIVVDELDRCRPDFALGLLERIKHLFEVEGVAFVLLVNRQQIENYIRAVYGDEVDARSYLLKFGSLFVDLPSNCATFATQYTKGRLEYCHSLFEHFGFAKLGANIELANCAAHFADHFDMTLRELEKVFATLAVKYSARWLGDPFLDSLFAILKVKLPLIFEAAKDSKLSVSEFFRETNIDRMASGFRDAYGVREMFDLLEYSLLTDEELVRATTEGAEAGSNSARFEHAKRRLHSNRREMIPRVCWGLEQFALNPR